MLLRILLMTKTFGHIGVLMGGYSSEREISLKSGQAVFAALREAGCRVSALDITVQEEERIFQFIKEAKIDVAFIALHGRLGEDGAIQAVLEKAGIPYPGSGVEASRLAINKAKTQKILKEKNIPVADYIILSHSEERSDEESNPEEILRFAQNDGKTLFRNNSQIAVDQIITALNLPVVVKPSCEGSSIGIAFVQEKEHLPVALAAAFSYGNEVLVERYISGKELTVGILDQKPLPVVEICPKNNFFDFASKYQPGMTEYKIPARISAEETKRVQSLALCAHQAVGCEDFSRVDLIQDKAGNLFVLEINTIPGFTAMSLLPKAARADGVNFTDLCLTLIRLAYEKKK